MYILNSLIYHVDCGIKSYTKNKQSERKISPGYVITVRYFTSKSIPRGSEMYYIVGCIHIEEYKYIMKTEKYSRKHYIFMCKNLLYHESFSTKSKI